MTSRRFTMEGALHLYSSLPAALTPADIYRAAAHAPARDFLVGSNIYVITCRPRILIDAADLHLDGDRLCGYLLVVRDGGWARAPFRFPLKPQHHGGEPERCRVSVEQGTHVELENRFTRELIPAHVIIAMGECELRDGERDLHVLYVGQSLGKNGERLAIDRLSRHTTFQRILADFHTYHPGMELLILLYRFEHAKTLLSSGGDLTLVPAATDEEERAHFRKIQTPSFERRKRIALAEAALIHFFQPRYNVIFKKTNFAAQRKLKFLETLVAQDMVGLTVEVSAVNVRARLYSDSRSPVSHREETVELLEGVLRGHEGDQELRGEIEAMLMTHHISIPLTTAEERDSFLHGMRWHGDEKREPFI